MQTTNTKREVYLPCGFCRFNRHSIENKISKGKPTLWARLLTAHLTASETESFRLNRQFSTAEFRKGEIKRYYICIFNCIICWTLNAFQSWLDSRVCWISNCLWISNFERPHESSRRNWIPSILDNGHSRIELRIGRRNIKLRIFNWKFIENFHSPMGWILKCCGLVFIGKVLVG